MSSSNFEKEVLRWGGGRSRYYPETFLLGIVKLLHQDERTLSVLLRGEEFDELKQAQKAIRMLNLNEDVLRFNMRNIIRLLEDNEEQQELCDECVRYVQDALGEKTWDEIIPGLLKFSRVPIVKLFTIEADPGELRDYLYDLREKNSERRRQRLERERAEREAKESAVQVGPPEPVDDEFLEEIDSYYEGGDDTDSSDAANSSQNDELNIIKISEKYRSLTSELLKVIKGQDAAVEQFVEGCFSGDLFKDRSNKNCPKAVFFFFGPPGTGKTLLARTAADVLHLEHDFYDMTHYSSEKSIDELIGTSPIYSNNREGLLTEFVSKNPKSIILFDEIEKAHINVLRMFLAILGTGALKSKYTGKDVSFKDTIIIFTSNVGKELYKDRTKNLSLIPKNVLVDAISREMKGSDPVFPPEIVSRIASGNTILFNHHSVRTLNEMANESFNLVATKMSEDYKCNITFSPKLPLLFLYHYGNAIDARVAINQSEEFLISELYELSRQLEKFPNGEIKSIHFDIDWSGIPDEIKELFVQQDKTEILVFGRRKIFPCFPKDRKKYIVRHANTIEQAREMLKHNISAIFIDPFCRKNDEVENILSIADYDTEGVDFFHEVMSKELNIPTFMVDANDSFSEVDRKSFVQEGATGTLRINWNMTDSFDRQVCQLLEELYMEKASQVFSQRGWIVDFNTKQDVSKPGNIDIIFYDLKKKRALDSESRKVFVDDARRPKIKFKDVIGASTAKEELQYFIEFLKDPKGFTLGGNVPPKGVLLYGPPGTGKTMLAKAMAGESDVNFVETTAAGFFMPRVGDGEAQIRSVFKRARSYAPAIIFIDEIDAIGKQRTGNGFNESREALLNTLLTEMDGFNGQDPDKPVFVLAATNFGARDDQDGIDTLDEALIRRFDNKIKVGLPNEEERRSFLKKQLEKKNASVTEDVLDNLAKRTLGLSPAILQNIIDAAFRSAMRDKEVLDNGYILTALEDYEYGEKREHCEEYYREVAIHELGHAYVSHLAGVSPEYITIESRGSHGGYMMPSHDESKGNRTRAELLAMIRTCVAGRAAEQVFFGVEKSLNTGASSDLEMATRRAFEMVGSLAMEEDQFVVLSKEEILNSPLAAVYIQKINDIIRNEMNNAITIIEDGRDVIEYLAKELIKDNYLTGQQFNELLAAYDEEHSIAE